MKKMKLTREEKAIERAAARGEYKPVSPAEHQKIVNGLMRRRKDAVLNIRINSFDLENIRKKAKRLGVPYQTYIAELLHRFAA
jgi:predicted DNA binding CopG/RHH family protein